jgi:hypothetical protein
VVIAAAGAQPAGRAGGAPRLRRQLPLLVFHLALLALVLLAGAGRLLSAGRPLRADRRACRSTAA